MEPLIANFDASFQYSETLMKMCARLTEAIRKEGLLFRSEQTLPLIAFIYNTFPFSSQGTRRQNTAHSSTAQVIIFAGRRGQWYGINLSARD